jgi:prevent-host-death family protein
MTYPMTQSKFWPSSQNLRRANGWEEWERHNEEGALSQAKDDLSKFLRVAEKEEILITRHGKPAGILIGFQSEDDWFDYRLETSILTANRIGENEPALRARCSVARPRPSA